MTFRPSTHGWPFGDVRPLDAHALGLGATPAAEPGLGGGLCWAALDRYLRGVKIARHTPAPEPGDALYGELVRRQAAALQGVWPRVESLQVRPDGSWRDRLPVRVPGGADAASVSRREWRGIRKQLDAGRPVLLTLLEPADGYRRARSARQVLAVGWRRRNARIIVSIYDPTRPGDDDAHLAFGLRRELYGRLSDGTRIRGFFAVPYDRERPRTLRAETFDDRAVIGLNRPVRGRVEPLAAPGRLDLLARDPDGALLHFRRPDGKSWDGTQVTRDELSGFEIHSDPTALVQGRALHVFGRSYVGDLLHFQLGRDWQAENRTDHKRAGPRFRLRGRPSAVAGPWKRLNVVGTDKDGGLVHYERHPVRGWRAEQVAGDPLAADPVAVRVEGTLRVLGIGVDGRLVHWEREGEEWSADLPAWAPEVDGSTRLAGPLAIHVADACLHVAARSRDGRLIAYRRPRSGGWIEDVLGDGLAGAPVACAGPAGLHLFAARQDGDVLHAWYDDEWTAEQIFASRPGFEALALPDRLAAWGGPSELRVWAREERDLWSLHWRPDSDWTVDRMSEWDAVEARHLPGDDPIALADEAGRPHLFCTDGRGTVLHVEARDGRTTAAPARRPEPAVAALAPQPAAPRPRPVEPAVAEPVAEASTAPEPAPEPEGTPAPDPVEFDAVAIESFDEPEPAADTAEPDFIVLESFDDPEPIEVEPVAEPEPQPLETEAFFEELELEPVETEAFLEVETDPEPLPLSEVPEEPEPLPLLEDPAEAADDTTEEAAAAEEEPAGPAPDLPYLDFDGEPSPPPREFGYDGGRPGAGAPGEAAADAEDRAEADEAAGADPDPGAAVRRYPQQPDFGRKSVERPKPDTSVPEVEPMDLSLMDAWPPPTPSKGRRRAKEKEERETS